MAETILVTGGCGYIGSHTIVDLLQNGFRVISIDNLSRSTEAALNGIEKITGTAVTNYKVDLCNLAATRQVFEAHPDISGIIHFAAYKTVPESVAEPLKYYHNNLYSLLNVLKCVKEFDVGHFVFSSSCSVYGNADTLPVTEDSPVKEAESPYGRTKQIGEAMIRDFQKAHTACSSILLRYFNPVGAHPSAHIGEYALQKPDNLVPFITQTAAGIREKLTVFGGDYPTRDGTCIRDYIHVMDIAHAHTLALQYLIDGKQEQTCEVFNLGTGKGVTVLEVIEAFEAASGVKLNYDIGERRPGDVVEIYANNTLAREKLGWHTQYTLHDMMLSAWKWQQQLDQ